MRTTHTRPTVPARGKATQQESERTGPRRKSPAPRNRASTGAGTRTPQAPRKRHQLTPIAPVKAARRPTAAGKASPADKTGPATKRSARTPAGKELRVLKAVQRRLLAQPVQPAPPPASSRTEPVGPPPSLEPKATASLPVETPLESSPAAAPPVPRPEPPSEQARTVPRVLRSRRSPPPGRKRVFVSGQAQGSVRARTQPLRPWRTSLRPNQAVPGSRPTAGAAPVDGFRAQRLSGRRRPLRFKAGVRQTLRRVVVPVRRRAVETKPVLAPLKPIVHWPPKASRGAQLARKRLVPGAARRTSASAPAPLRIPPRLRSTDAAPPPSTRDRLSTTILYVCDVTVSFDGFKALNGLNFYVDPGEMRAVIGPNGAGKTTMMDVITGKTKPQEGDILFNGKVDLTRLDEAAIARLGIGRKFQKPTVFENHTVMENLELALKDKRGVLRTLFARLSGAQKDRLDELLRITRLTGKTGRLAGELSHGEKQWLEIGMLLAQDPELLFLDEPAAGMTDAETEQTAELLRGIAGQHSIVVVEHDMAFIRSLGVRVTVLHEGRVIAEGPMDKVQEDPHVIEVYLGR